MQTMVDALLIFSSLDCNIFVNSLHFHIFNSDFWHFGDNLFFGVGISASKMRRRI